MLVTQIRILQILSTLVLYIVKVKVMEKPTL